MILQHGAKSVGSSGFFGRWIPLQHGAARIGSSDFLGRWIPVAGKGGWLRAGRRLNPSEMMNAKVPVFFSFSLLLLLAIFTSITPTAFAADVVVSSVVLRLLDEAEAPARVAGVVVAVEAQEGDYVKRGDLLAQLDDAESQLAVAAAKIDAAIALQAAENDTPIRYAAKAAEAARAELQRSNESIAKFPKSVSQSQIDVERLTIEKATLEKEGAEETQKQAKLEHELRKSRLDAAEWELSRRRIVAPLDGMVIETLVRPGEWLQPGQKAFRIVRTDRLKAEGFVLAKDARGDLVGKAVTLTSSASENHQGHIVFVSPEVDPITGQVRVWAEIDNRAGTWRPGDRVEMTIVKGTP